jgi:hypothetical protein
LARKALAEYKASDLQELNTEDTCKAASITAAAIK